MDLVGLTLEVRPYGTYVVAGVADPNDPSVVEAVRPGDRLLRIDNLDVTGRSLAEVVDALRGGPGDIRALALSRGGDVVAGSAPVASIV